MSATLNQTLAQMGFTTCKSTKKAHAKELFKGGESLGHFTAHEAWAFLRGAK